MKTKKNFPNGFEEWAKTHFEIVRYLEKTTHLCGTPATKKQAAEGVEGLAIMAFQMADAFEQEKADGDSVFTIEEWTNKFTKIFI